MLEGRNESEAVRTALAEAGRRRRRSASLEVEVRRLAADAEDRSARSEAMADKDAAAPNWPA